MNPIRIFTKQSFVREQQIARAVTITEEGEVADKNIYDLDLDRISEEEKYDGFYAVITNLEGDVGEILKINRQRWEIEENFRIIPFVPCR